MRHKATGLYNANLVKASLKVSEARVIAGLLLEQADAERWHQAVVLENVLQKRSPYTAETFASFIAHRLRTLGPDAWLLIRDGSSQIATQVVLAATIKYSRLTRDFLNLVVREKRNQFRTAITRRDWNDFIEGCAARDPEIEQWTEVVFDKLRQNMFRIMAEAGYVADTKTMTLQKMTVAPEVADLLCRLGDDDTLAAMRAAE